MADQFNSPMQSYEGWNVNASYLSPAYMSNFRPGYGDGGMRDNPYARQRSIGSSIAHLGPYDYAYGADSLQESSANMYNITTGAGDAAASLFQNVGIPVAAWYGMHKLNKFGMGGGSKDVGTRIGAKLGAGASRMFTGTAGRAAGAVGLGSMARGGAGMARGMAVGAAGLGGFAGSMFLPILAGQALASVADTALVDPYVATRRGMDAMRANTANQYISGDAQTASGGFGMSATRAQEISQALTEAGQGDFSLSGGKYNEIADNMMRAGIFQEVGDMDTTKIVDGVKKATSVLKLISRVTGDSDILAGIQTLATLKSGGLDDINKMEAAVNSLRGSSAASGVSLQQLMDTVGNQGQVMAQQQGMRGVTGLLASTDAYAGFTNARRAGLISGGQMQALGGAEGMTQNLMSGAYQMMSSGYGRMVMQGDNRFGKDIGGAIQRWGEGVSSDPIRSQGDWYANQGVYKERAMNDQGSAVIMLQTLKAKAVSMGLDDTDGLVISAMAQAEGLDPMQFRSMAEADRARSDPASRMRMSDSKRTSDRSDYASKLQQDGLGMRGVPVLGVMQEAWKQGSRAFLEGGAEFMSPVTEGIASVSDDWEAMLASTKGIITDDNMSHLIGRGDEFASAKFKGYDKSLGRPGALGKPRAGAGDLVESDSQKETISKLNRLMLSSDPKIRTKTSRMLSSLVDNDSSEAFSIYKELDADSSGFLSGSKTPGYRRNAHYEDIGKVLEEGRLQADTTSTRIKKVERTVEMDLNEALRSSDPSAAIDDLMKSKGISDPELLKTLGITKDSLKGLSADKQKMLISDKTKSWQNRDMADIEGNNSEQYDQFISRFQKQGFKPSEIDSYFTSKGMNIHDTIESDFNPVFGDTGDATRELTKELDRYRADKDKSDKQGSDTDWSRLIDVTDGIGKLGPAVESNTGAIEANTKVQIALLENRSGTKYATSSYQNGNLTENSVGDVPRSAMSILKSIGGNY